MQENTSMKIDSKAHWTGRQIFIFMTDLNKKRTQELNIFHDFCLYANFFKTIVELINCLRKKESIASSEKKVSTIQIIG